MVLVALGETIHITGLSPSKSRAVDLTRGRMTFTNVFTRSASQVNAAALPSWVVRSGKVLLSDTVRRPALSITVAVPPRSFFDIVPSVNDGLHRKLPGTIPAGRKEHTKCILGFLAIHRQQKTSALSGQHNRYVAHIRLIASGAPTSGLMRMSQALRARSLSRSYG